MSLKSKMAGIARTVVGEKLYKRMRIGRRREYRHLCGVRGVIHVGANTGQEADLYGSFGLDVLWIEPIPKIFEKLKLHVSKFPKQSALNYLVTEEDDKEYPLHIASNGGESSSILALSRHSEMWPEVTYTDCVVLKGVTLSTLLEREGVDLRRFDTLVLDTQGSELRVLTGAVRVLPNFKFAKVEVPDFESYSGCCQVGELSAFMLSNGFCEYARFPFKRASGVGTYFDVVYRRRLR